MQFLEPLLALTFILAHLSIHWVSPILAAAVETGEISRYSKRTFNWNVNGKKTHGTECLLPHTVLTEIELDKTKSPGQIKTKLDEERCRVDHFLECISARVPEHSLTTEDPLDIRSGTCQCSLAAGGPASVVTKKDGCRIPVGKMGLSACNNSQSQFKGQNFDQHKFIYPSCAANATCRRDQGNPHLWCHCRIGFKPKEDGTCSKGNYNHDVTRLLLVAFITGVITVVSLRN